MTSSLRHLETSRMDRAYLIAVVVTLVFAIGLLAGIFGTRAAQHVADDWPATIKSASDFMTAIGILFAGLWTGYLIHRRRSLEPRAALVHHFQLWHQGQDRFLRLSIEIRNPSEVTIRPGDGSTQVQRPPAGEFDPKQYSEQFWQDIVRLRHSLGFESVHIEPKESETFTHDINLPDGVRYIQLTTEMACVRTRVMERPLALGRPKEDLVINDETDRWTLTTLIDLEAISLKPAPIESRQETSDTGPAAADRALTKCSRKTSLIFCIASLCWATASLLFDKKGEG